MQVEGTSPGEEFAFIRPRVPGVSLSLNHFT